MTGLRLIPSPISDDAYYVEDSENGYLVTVEQLKGRWRITNTSRLGRIGLNEEEFERRRAVNRVWAAFQVLMAHLFGLRVQI